jgi:hypothetical protein
VVLVFGSQAWAQQINIESRTGPNGTHFPLELPISSYTYEADTYCSYSYNHVFKVWHNTTLKVSTSFDVINPSSPTYYSNTVSFEGWDLRVGDTVRFYSQVKIIAGPYINQRDTDNQYGDVVDYFSFAPPDEHVTAFAPSAIDERRRFEDLLG